MKRTTIDLWVGIFVALGAAALVFLSFQVATQNTFSRDSIFLWMDHRCLTRPETSTTSMRARRSSSSSGPRSCPIAAMEVREEQTRT